MLELILGMDWTANTDAVLDRVSEDVRQRHEALILLVPELISHDMERRLCAAAGDTSSRYAEVLSFTRLARRVSESVGSAVMECLDNGGRVVAMAAAAQQLHSRLKAYAALETKPEFLTQLVDAVDEFKRCCITADDLRLAAARTEGALAQKLEELSLLLESYDALCQRGKRDPRDQMSWVLEELEDSDFAKNHRFYIDGFPDFTRQHLAILEHLIRESDHVTVSLNCDRVGSKLLAFEKAGSTAAELVKCAQKAGVPVSIMVIPHRDTPVWPAMDKLFQGNIQKTDSLEGKLRLWTADSMFQECQAVARDIQQRVMYGCRYRDISVVCTDMASYRPVIGLVFRRMGIPVYLSGTDDVLHMGAVMTVLTALEAALGGFEQKAVLRYLRSALSPLKPETCDLVENYAVVWAVNGNRWKEEWTNHPEGLSGVWTDGFRHHLSIIEQARKNAVEPLIKLQEKFRSAVCLADQVRAVYGFLEDIQFAGRLGKLAEELDGGKDDRSSQILNQLWEILLTALEQLYDVLGETVWSDEAFQRLFVLLLSQYDVGTIPTVLDSVTVGPVSAMRCQREKHLYVLGASEGSLPGYTGSTGVLTDQERVALRQLNVQLTGGALEGIQAEFAEVFGVFCGAQESVTVSCSSTQPSYVFRRLRDLSGSEEVVCVSMLASDAYDSAGLLAKLDASAAAEELGILDEYRDVCARRDYTLGRITRGNIDKLYGGRLNLSASQVDRQAECRFSYFLKYGLRARERKEAKVDPAEFGTYVHAVLEETARDVMAKGGFHQVSLEQTMEIANQHSEAYAKEHFSQIDSKRMEYLFRRNVQELSFVVQELWEELSEGQFEPVDFELGFGGEGKMPAIQVPSRDMQAQLIGFVDRVDAYRVGGANFFRVVDYKTGKKDFDYCDVFNGVGLQMLLYLFALEQEGEDILGTNPIPAGVQYFPARVPYVSLDGAGEDEAGERRKNWKRRGLLLNDELALTAMDPDEDMPRLSCKRKKDGTLVGDLAQRDQLKQLRKYVFRLLGSMVDEIASGTVEPNPYTRGSSHSACAFCPYGAVCRKESVAGKRSYKAMSPQWFWEEIEKEVGSNG